MDLRSPASKQALKAAQHATNHHTSKDEVEMALRAAHHHRLGQDQSVCLRDIIEALKIGEQEPSGTWGEYGCPSAFITEAFTRGGGKRAR